MIRNPTEVKGEDRDSRFPEHHGRGKDKYSRRKRRERQEKFNAQKGMCWWCREKMSMEALKITENGNWKDNSKFASFEHLIPKGMGGKNIYSNRVLAHAGCNNKRHKRKWAHDPIYGEKAHDNPPNGKGEVSKVRSSVHCEAADRDANAHGLAGECRQDQESAG